MGMKGMGMAMAMGMGMGMGMRKMGISCLSRRSQLRQVTRSSPPDSSVVKEATATLGPSVP